MDPKNGRYIVNGAHDGPRLQELLDGFIKNFVLCEECDNPETNLVILAVVLIVHVAHYYMHTTKLCYF